jgi:hypothetical protein
MQDNHQKFIEFYSDLIYKYENKIKKLIKYSFIITLLFSISVGIICVLLINK